MLAIAALVPLAHAEPRTLSPFEQAEAAYKAGRWDDAIRTYDDILASGSYAPELFFNRGNANFKKGDLGAAILDYRRATALAPRDGDIQANLRFALERAGAPAIQTSVPASVASRLTREEWTLLAVLAYWAAGLLFAHHLWWGHLWARKGALFAAMAGLIALTGLLERRHVEAEPEFVVQTRCQALFAPFEKATPHFELPAGSVVRSINRTGDWIEVRSGDQTGWIQIGASKEVSAWQAGAGT
jgi:tetratricopeptide (TPR) repeat protein